MDGTPAVFECLSANTSVALSLSVCVQLQVVNFNETLKCLAKGVAGMNVDVTHAPYQGSMHEWFAATIIQANYRGRVHRRQVMEKRAAMRAALGVVSEGAGLDDDVEVEAGHEEEKPPEEIDVSDDEEKKTA
jgi:hypothetical protein